MPQNNATRVQDFFQKELPKRMQARSELVEQVGAVYQFVVTGEKTSHWRVDLTVPGGKVEASEQKAPCAIAMNEADLVDLIEGRLNPQIAFMSGKLQISGDMGSALKLSMLFH